MRHGIVAVIYLISLLYRTEGKCLLSAHHIRELLVIPYDHGIQSAG